MRFIVGSNKVLDDYLDQCKDYVHILSHNDTDGMVSAYFMEKILNERNIEVSGVQFLKYGLNMLDNVITNKNTIALDLNLDTASYDKYQTLRKSTNLMLIDHHPLNPKNVDLRNTIKTITTECTSYFLYHYGNYGESEKKLFHAAIYADMGYFDPLILEELNVPGLTIDNIVDSEFAILPKKIINNLIYFNNNTQLVYDIIKKSDYSKLDKISSIVEPELKSKIDEFRIQAIYARPNIMIYKFDSSLDIVSHVASHVSIAHPEQIILCASGQGDDLKISIRNQSGQYNVNELAKKACLNLGTAGGHEKSSGAVIKKKDWDIFEKRLIDLV